MKNTIGDFKELGQIVLKKLADYVSDSRKEKVHVLKQEHPEKIAGKLNLEKLIREGSLNNENIEEWLHDYLMYSQHMHHPHYIGHQVAVPHLSAGLADMIHGVINNPMAIYEMGPPAASIEKVIINWMLEKIGWFQADELHESDDKLIKGGGVLTHGGSLANLTAMLAARASIDPGAWSDGVDEKLVVLVPQSSHYSLARAVSIMGMGASKLINMPTDKNEVVLVEEARKLILEEKNKGHKIMALVANACATSTGLYDPVDELAELCLSHNLWFHVDGAHGAGALLLDKEKHLLKGVEKADSMIWDAHKMLRTSALSAAVLVKDFNKLNRTFRQEGDYLIFKKDQIGFDFLHNTVECTKNGLGPKVFWALAAEGEKSLANNIQLLYDNAKSFYKFFAEQEDFTCPYFPESNILCFRYTGKSNSDDLQLDIRRELTKNGNFYITVTTIKGKRYLRLTIMNELTGLKHIKALAREIREIVKNLN